MHWKQLHIYCRNNHLISATRASKSSCFDAPQKGYRYQLFLPHSPKSPIHYISRLHVSKLYSKSSEDVVKWRQCSLVRRQYCISSQQKGTEQSDKKKDCDIKMDCDICPPDSANISKNMHNFFSSKTLKLCTNYSSAKMSIPMTTNQDLFQLFIKNHDKTITNFTHERTLSHLAYRKHQSEQLLLHKTAGQQITQCSRYFSLSPQKIVELAPTAVQPYLRLIRLDRPIGTWLLFWPCTWSIGLAASAGHLPDVGMLALFGLGSFLMRGAGCIINDMWDKDFDAKVARTKDRPLACGQLTYFQALCCLGFNLSASLAILLTFNNYSIILGASSMLLVVTYPLMKRITYWPQLFLGLTLNWGVLISWSALHGSMTTPGFTLYGACVLYTMIYDTIYSHQDKEDDILIGVKSTALKLGDQTKPWCAGFSSVMVSGLLATGYMCEQTWPYYLGVMGVASHLAWQISTVDLNNPDDCGAKFRSNTRLGALLFTAIVTGTLMKDKKDDDKTLQNTEHKSMSDLLKEKKELRKEKKEFIEEEKALDAIRVVEIERERQTQKALREQGVAVMKGVQKELQENKHD